jgi:hypothetical protein
MALSPQGLLFMNTEQYTCNLCAFIIFVFFWFQLCLTIQSVMEGRMPKMWDILSISHSQYLELSMKLDLKGTALRARDWTEFAEWIGNNKIVAHRKTQNIKSFNKQISNACKVPWRKDFNGM